MQDSSDLTVPEVGQEPTFNSILDKMMDNMPIPDAYMMSVWINFLNYPTFSYIEQNFGLWRDEYNVLSCLAAYGNLTASQICLVTGRPKNSMARSIARLLKRKMITRRIDKLDRRRQILKIEAIGQKTYETILPLFVEREKMMMSPLNAADRKSLNRILKKLMLFQSNWAAEF